MSRGYTWMPRQIGSAEPEAKGLLSENELAPIPLNAEGAAVTEFLLFIHSLLKDKSPLMKSFEISKPFGPEDRLDITYGTIGIHRHIFSISYESLSKLALGLVEHNLRKQFERIVQEESL